MMLSRHFETKRFKLRENFIRLTRYLKSEVVYKDKDIHTIF